MNSISKLHLGLLKISVDQQIRITLLTTLAKIGCCYWYIGMPGHFYMYILFNICL